MIPCRCCMRRPRHTRSLRTPQALRPADRFGTAAGTCVPRPGPVALAGAAVGTMSAAPIAPQSPRSSECRMHGSGGARAARCAVGHRRITGYGDLHILGVLAECPRLRSRRTRDAASAACMAPGARGQRGVRSATATVALLPIAEPGKRPAPGRRPRPRPALGSAVRACACVRRRSSHSLSWLSLSWLSRGPGFRDVPETPGIYR
jgi:hypothetical protein